MSGKALVLSRDRNAVEVLREAFARYNISVDVCTDPDATQTLLGGEAFQAVVFDCAMIEKADALMAMLKNQGENWHTIAIALAGSAEQSGPLFELGAKFVLVKPLTSDGARENAHALADMLKRERRRHDRYPLKAAIAISCGDQEREVNGQVVDLSEGGIKLRCEEEIGSALSLRMRYQLPGGKEINAIGEVVWRNEKELGAKIVFVSPKRFLDAWLAQHTMLQS